MKQYKIINTDIQLNGKLFPEGSTINLDDKDAESLSNYLEEVNNSLISTDHSSLTNNKEQITKQIKRKK